MRVVGLLLIVWSVAVLLLTWLGYPAWLRIRAKGQPMPLRAGTRAWWPSVTIVVVVRNEERNLRDLLPNLFALAYPADRRRILVVSDASSDFTDAVAKVFEHHGVDLLRIMKPVGAARALNLARKHVRSDVAVVVDPSARLVPSALAALVAPFSDATVGVTYGHETGPEALGEPVRETPYRSYESMLRERETRVFGTVSARRTLYAVRGPLFHAPVSPWLSPDFMLALLAREHGYRALHVNDAQCVITRADSIKPNYARTVWEVGRDVLTLMRKPELLDPRRYGAFAWMLLGHKMGRWLTPWALLVGVAGLVLLMPTDGWARGAVGVCLGMLLASVVFALIPGESGFARIASLPGRAAATAVAIAHASVRALIAAPVSQQPVRVTPSRA